VLDLPKGWIGRLLDYPPILKAAQRSGRCCGTFWDNTKKRQVVLDLGQVFINVPFVFRAVPSEGKPRNVLSWDEGTAQSTDFSFLPTVHNEHRLESGFVVIPGLTPTDRSDAC